MAGQLLPLEDALKALTAEDRAALTTHPSLEELIAYQEESLPPQQAESLREHLVLCEECSARLLDLAAFLTEEPPEGDEPLHDDDVAKAWEAMQRRLPVAPPLAFPRRSRQSRLALPLAAGLLLVTTFFAGRMILQDRQTALRNPQTVDLDLSRGGTRSMEEIFGGHSSRPLKLLARGIPLALRGRSLHTEVRQSLDGNIVWEQEDRRSDGESLELGTVPARKLKAGVYEIDIYDQGSGERVSTFNVRVD